eukprot:m.150214 g.150214  ORF g.150214 m.150214 type:complete len:123 (+) comp9744_c0_seq3:724-1092(+)
MRLSIATFIQYGGAYHAGECSLTKLCGTPGYVAPDVLMGTPYGHKVDCWAIGVIAYILLCGSPPFYDEDVSEIYQKIVLVDYTFEYEAWDAISELAKTVVRHLLVFDPDQRFECADCLQLPW